MSPPLLVQTIRKAQKLLSRRLPTQSGSTEKLRETANQRSWAKHPHSWDLFLAICLMMPSQSLGQLNGEAGKRVAAVCFVLIARPQDKCLDTHPPMEQTRHILPTFLPSFLPSFHSSCWHPAQVPPLPLTQWNAATANGRLLQWKPC